jgi:ADP-ribose pyrophosphatase YjhB (NUDIX family)
MATTSGQDSNPETRVGVGVLLMHESGRILLTLRDRPPETGRSSIARGQLDYLETLEQCALREALGEVGVAIWLVRLRCVTDASSISRKPALGFACIPWRSPHR